MRGCPMFCFPGWVLGGGEPKEQQQSAPSSASSLNSHHGIDAILPPPMDQLCEPSEQPWEGGTVTILMFQTWKQDRWKCLIGQSLSEKMCQRLGCSSFVGTGRGE